MSTTAISATGDTAVDQNAQSTRWNNWGMLKAFAFRLLVTYFIFNLFRKPSQNQVGEKYSAIPATNLFDTGTSMDLYTYLSESDTFDAFNQTDALFWHQQGIIYGDWNAGENLDGSYSKAGIIKCGQFPSLMHNGTLYLHVFIVKSGYSPDPTTGDRYSQKFTIQKTKMLTRHKRRRLSRTVNLLTGQTEAHPDLRANDASDSKSNVIYQDAITHWHPNLTINVVNDHSQWIQGAVPPPLDQFIEFNTADAYYPIVYFNDYWNLNEDYKPVNETTPTLPFQLTLAPLSLFKWQLYAAQSVRKTWLTQILGDSNLLQNDVQDDEEQDTLKKTLVETSPFLLALTAIVSVVHSVFELLAFKNDIQFWRTRESLEGLSVRSVFFNVFQSVIVVLYVWDNDTNFVIKISVILGLLIEVWKIKKVLVIQVDHNSRILGLVPRVHIDYQSSYVETDTKKYDQMAFQYLSCILFPMFAIYCGYSLLYQEHRGWYSWVLNMLYGFLLTFGFIMMTPQLFINYKLKSVAHLPWRMLTYKALNTFIDDLFAFVIKMPTLYRIGCLRDDVIFFIYLYQRWIYPMDPNRVNEFGVSKEMLDSKTKAVHMAISNGELHSQSMKKSKEKRDGNEPITTQVTDTDKSESDINKTSDDEQDDDSSRKVEQDSTTDEAVDSAFEDKQKKAKHKQSSNKHNDGLRRRNK